MRSRCLGCSCRRAAHPTLSCSTWTPCPWRPWASQSMLRCIRDASLTSTPSRHRHVCVVPSRAALCVCQGVLVQFNFFDNIKRGVQGATAHCGLSLGPFPARCSTAHCPPPPSSALRFATARCTMQTTPNPRRQAFHTLYHSDDSVLLGAPTGSGKTISSELTMMRLWEAHPGDKVCGVCWVGLGGRAWTAPSGHPLFCLSCGDPSRPPLGWWLG
jgi:hypothetical protein